MLKPYENYKEAGLPWLLVVPEHWAFLRSKNVFVEKKDIVGNDFGKYTLLSLTKNGIIARDISSGKGKFPKDFNTYKIVQPGDMVFCLFDIDETPRTVGLSSLSGMITGAYTVFQVKNINSKYLYYYYLCLDDLKALKPLYTGLRKVIGVSSFLATKIPVPPREEQDKITNYLDWKTSEMAHFIHEKKKKIKLLQDLKKSLICHYSLKGIYWNREFYESDYPWIENVAVGWKETRLKNVLMKLYHVVRPEDELLICSNSGKVFFRGNSKLGLVADSDDIYQGVRKGDLLIHGMDTWHGAIAVSDFDGKCTPVVHVCDSCQNKRYIAYYLQALAFKKVYKIISNGVRENTSDFRSWSKAGNINVLVPPLDEQNAIVELLDTKCRQIEDMISALNNEITLVGELHIKTISDVVTGKVDVRNVDIPEYEPDADDDIEEIDDTEELDEQENLGEEVDE